MKKNINNRLLYIIAMISLFIIQLQPIKAVVVEIKEKPTYHKRSSLDNPLKSIVKDINKSQSSVFNEAEKNRIRERTSEEILSKARIERLKELRKLEIQRKKEKEKQILRSYMDQGYVGIHSVKSDLTKMREIVTKQKVTSLQRDLINAAKNYLGKVYVYGGSDTQTYGRSYDCSGFTQSAFKKIGVNLPRTAAQQYNATKRISYDELKTGDLVFFINTYPTSGASHVGIYLGDGYMIHASSGDGFVTIENTFSKYFVDHFLGYGRPIK